MNVNKHWLLFVLTFVLVIPMQAQQDPAKVFDQIEGYWQGAFIKNNAHQRMDVQFFENEGKFLSLQIIEEWHPQFGEFQIPVEVDSAGTITMNTGHGKAKMNLDANNLEIIGQLENTAPVVYVHLKKTAPPPSDPFDIVEVTIDNSGIQLAGHLHIPKISTQQTAIIVVGGRGCYPGSTKYDLTAKMLREYGVATLVYNKRGTGKSSGDCDQATIEDLASDVRACKEFLENHPNGFQKIGVIGSSAGGWVMLKAQEKSDFDFLISVVGPSTSVKDQQIQSAVYGTEFYKLSEDSKTELLNYTELLCEAEASEKTFESISNLLLKAEENGWMELLDETDKPSSKDDIQNLWVRRHSFDPGKILSQFQNPYLAIYGDKDWIVPYKENVKRLNELFEGERAKLLKTVVAYNAEHGTEKEGKYINMKNEHSYWHFFRISPQVKIEIIQFLKDNGFI
ncbi:MAG: alpha/beta hydrolase [Saprospiraceae bacterium]|nr:alpha/beta hydrolase [Saprospiraceae bacterium]